MPDKEMLEKHLLYIEAYGKRLKRHYECGGKDTDEFTKMTALYGVKIFNSRDRSTTIDPIQINKDFEFSDSIQSIMALLTPNEFIQIFPIDKEYDGHKTGCIDYYYTKKYLSTLDLDEPIGRSKIAAFLSHYHNSEIRKFINESLDMLKVLVVEMNTYTHFKISNGDEYLRNHDTGENIRVKTKNDTDNELKNIKR